MWAAGEGYNEICIALLNAGAETDILNATNYTAGSDLNARNLGDWTSLMMTAARNDLTRARISFVPRRRL